MTKVLNLNKQISIHSSGAEKPKPHDVGNLNDQVSGGFSINKPTSGVSEDYSKLRKRPSTSLPSIKIRHTGELNKEISRLNLVEEEIRRLTDGEDSNEVSNENISEEPEISGLTSAATVALRPDNKGDPPDVLGSLFGKIDLAMKEARLELEAVHQREIEERIKEAPVSIETSDAAEMLASVTGFEIGDDEEPAKSAHSSLSLERVAHLLDLESL